MSAARGSKSLRKRSGSLSNPRIGQAESGRLAEALWRFLPPAMLAVLTGVFFWDLITPLASGRAWLWEDFLHQNYPYRFFSATSLARGIFPFWNPYVFGGMPFFADIQTAVLYPLNFIQVLFAGPDSLSPYVVQLIEVLHYLIAAWLTYRYLRFQKLREEACLVGAVTFAFSGFLVTHALHMNFISVIVWFPLILELFQRALDTSRLRYAVGCSLVLALSTMGGYPQYSLYICYALGLYWLVHELEQLKLHGWNPRGSAFRLTLTVAVVALGVGLNAYNWLPSAELAQYTPRSTMTWQDSVEHSLEPLFLLKLLVPGLFGVQHPDMNTYWAGGYSSFWETCLFVGVLPLALALYALGGFGGERRVRFAAVLGATTLLLALGKYGFLYKLFFQFAPGFDRFRIPGRLAVLVSFALAMLAAYGWERLAAKRGRGEGGPLRGPFYVSAGLCALVAVLILLLRSGALEGLGGGILARPEVRSLALGGALRGLGWCAAAAGFLAVAGALRGRKLRFAGYFAALFAFVELFTFGRPFLLGNESPAEHYDGGSLVRNLRLELERELFRVNARSLDNPGIMVLRRNQGSLDRVFLLEGYNPLQLKRRLGEVDVPRRMDLLNVKYRISVDYQERRVGLELNPTYLPRAFMAYGWRIAEPDEQAIEILNSPEFDHRGEVVLERDPGIDSPAEPEHIESNVEIVSYGQNEILLEVNSPEDGILVLSEWDYPAWKAWVGDEPREVLRANHALRAIVLEKGVHSVRFAYSSDSFRTGLTISLALAVLTLVFSIAAARSGRGW